MLQLTRSVNESIRIGLGSADRLAVRLTVVAVAFNHVTLRLESKKFDSRHDLRAAGDLQITVGGHIVKIGLIWAERGGCKLSFAAAPQVKIERQERWEANRI